MNALNSISQIATKQVMPKSSQAAGKVNTNDSSAQITQASSIAKSNSPAIQFGKSKPVTVAIEALIREGAVGQIKPQSIAKHSELGGMQNGKLSKTIDKAVETHQTIKSEKSSNVSVAQMQKRIQNQKTAQMVDEGYTQPQQMTARYGQMQATG